MTRFFNHSCYLLSVVSEATCSWGAINYCTLILKQGWKICLAGVRLFVQLLTLSHWPLWARIQITVSSYIDLPPSWQRNKTHVGSSTIFENYINKLRKGAGKTTKKHAMFLIVPLCCCRSLIYLFASLTNSTPNFFRGEWDEYWKYFSIFISVAVLPRCRKNYRTCVISGWLSNYFCCFYAEVKFATSTEFC